MALKQKQQREPADSRSLGIFNPLRRADFIPLPRQFGSISDLPPLSLRFRREPFPYPQLRRNYTERRYGVRIVRTSKTPPRPVARCPTIPFSIILFQRNLQTSYIMRVQVVCTVLLVAFITHSLLSFSFNFVKRFSSMQGRKTLFGQPLHPQLVCDGLFVSQVTFVSIEAKRSRPRFLVFRFMRQTLTVGRLNLGLSGGKSVMLTV